MIDHLFDKFTFPVGTDVGSSDDSSNLFTLQGIHDVAIALGATCSRCDAGQSMQGRTKALDRGATRAAVMARAQLRRFNLDQDLSLVVAEAQSPLR